jgi:hypothetical protein
MMALAVWLDYKPPLTDGAEPDIMNALAMSHKRTAVLGENPVDVDFVARHQGRALGTKIQ